MKAFCSGYKEAHQEHQSMPCYKSICYRFYKEYNYPVFNELLTVRYNNNTSARITGQTLATVADRSKL